MHKSCTSAAEVVATPVRPLSLDHVVDEPLAAAQLKLVVAQVQHEPLVAASEAKEALAIGKHLTGSLRGPRPMAAPQMVLQVGAAHQSGPPLNLSAWQYVSDDEDWVATVAPEFFSVETKSYESWSGLRSRLEQLTSAVAEVLSPALVRRVGLRYVDELHVPGVTTPDGWVGRIAPAFLGAAGDTDIGPSVSGIQQAVEIHGPGGSKVVLRHGTVRTTGGQPAYLLDHDCFIDDSRSFDADELTGDFDNLHRLALGVFQRAITEKFYRQLKKGGLE